MRLARGRLALYFGLGTLLVALAGLLYVVDTINGAFITLIEIGALTHG